MFRKYNYDVVVFILHLISLAYLVGYIPAGGAQVPLTPINILASGDTGTLMGSSLTVNSTNTITNGSIPADAAIVVRVPVTVNIPSGTVSVTLGNTTSQPSNSNTPYLQGANGPATTPAPGDTDVYTVDNTDPSSISGEAAGLPINGDASGRRQEASAVSTAPISTGILISGNVWRDTDSTQIQDNGELGTEATGTDLTVYAVGSDGKVIAKSDVAADGTYSLSVPQNTTGINLRLINNSTIAILATAPTTPSLPNGWGNTGDNKNGAVESGVLGEISLNTTTVAVPGQNFGIDAFPLAKPPGSPGSAALCPTGVTLNVKVFLSGAYVNATGLMRDNLRVQSKVPLSEPYLGLGFSHGPGGGNETTNATVLATTGNNAIVDWVFLELRNTVNQVIATRSALVQRDGDIISADGTSGVKFDAPQGDYYVVVKHRNHLGAMTNAKVTFGATAATVDFTASSLPVYSSNSAFAGTERQVLNGSIVGLWTGNANQDNQIKFAGVDRESWAISGQVYGDPGNTNKIANYISQGYHVTDLDLSGSTILQGPNNDPDVVFFPVLTHPKNPSNDVNFIIPDLLPGANTISASSLCPTSTKANVMLVKRITAINGATTNPNDGSVLTALVNDGVTDSPDDALNWPANYLVGALNGGTIKPGDEVEYTIYYLNSGTQKAKQLRICDRLNANLTFKQDTGGIGKGIGFVPGNTTPIQYLTNDATDNDKGQITTPALATNCNLLSSGLATDDVVIVDVATTTDTANPLMGSTGPGIPTTSYGYIRITTTVK